jgi:assimilatory nitrate reductase catalytic subunit
VTEPAIGEQLSRCGGTPDERLASLQSALKCGTNCGSCLPELKRMVRASMPLQTA